MGSLSTAAHPATALTALAFLLDETSLLTPAPTFSIYSTQNCCCWALVQVFYKKDIKSCSVGLAGSLGLCSAHTKGINALSPSDPRPSPCAAHRLDFLANLFTGLKLLRDLVRRWYPGWSWQR